MSWRAEVWHDPVGKLSGTDRSVPLDEEQYAEMNDWCKVTLKYPARTAYHIFDFRKRSDLDWFLLRWT